MRTVAARRRTNARRMRRLESTLAGWEVGLQLGRARDAATRFTGTGWNRSKTVSALLLAASAGVVGRGPHARSLVYLCRRRAVP